MISNPLETPLETPKYPTRVLHVVGSMNRGGVETWLMNVLRNVSRDDLAFDFVVHKPDVAAYDEELLVLGAERYVCEWPSNPLVYAYNFLKILRDNGSYDVVHSHVHHFSGFVLLLAKLAGVPNRIAHGHSNTIEAQNNSSNLRKIYLFITRRLIKIYATSGIAVSREAAISLFGGSWQKDTRWSIVYCGINLADFDLSVDYGKMRNSLNIKNDAFVVGHVGRFDDAKNHDFLIDIFRELKSRVPNAVLLLVGDGNLRSNIEGKIKNYNLCDSVIFTGLRNDIPALMIRCMDIFIFPSKHEGLGLSLIEAQAAQLRCFASDRVPYEAKITKNLKFISLDNNSSDWADQILSPDFETDDSINNLIEFDIKYSIFKIREKYNAY